MTRTGWLLAIGAASWGGCAEFALNEATTSSDDAEADTAAAMEADVDDTLRVDVFPTSSKYQDLLSESFLLEGQDWRSLSLPLSQPVDLSGELTGFDANTQLDISVPGENASVEGEIIAQIPDTPMAHRAATDRGEFAFRAVPGAGYTVAWIPTDPADLPFLVETDTPLRSGLDLSRDLDYGVPLYGSVVDANGQGLSNMEVQAFHAESGIGGPIGATNAIGDFELRVFPGTYDLQIRGDSTRYYLPTRARTVEVGDDGAFEEIVYAHTIPVNVAGEVSELDDAAWIRDVTVRFTAVDSDDGASLVVETQTDNNGRFNVRVVEGSYSVEFIPEYEGAHSPLALPEAISVPEVAELDTIGLSERQLVEGWVVGPDGVGVEGARISAQEDGFDGYVYETSTDIEGRFSMEVSDTEMRWTLTPPADLDAAITFLEGTAESLLSQGQTLQFAWGEIVEGCVTFQSSSVEYALVELRDAEQALYATTSTDLDGCFSVRIDTGR